MTIQLLSPLFAKSFFETHTKLYHTKFYHKTHLILFQECRQTKLQRHNPKLENCQPERKNLPGERTCRKNRKLRKSMESCVTKRPNSFNKTRKLETFQRKHFRKKARVLYVLARKRSRCSQHS